MNAITPNREKTSEKVVINFGTLELTVCALLSADRLTQQEDAAAQFGGKLLVKYGPNLRQKGKIMEYKEDNFIRFSQLKIGDCFHHANLLGCFRKVRNYSDTLPDYNAIDVTKDFRVNINDDPYVRPCLCSADEREEHGS